MANIKEELATLRDPSTIQRAQIASSPYVLRKIFTADPTIHQLIDAGEAVLPFIEAELRDAGSLHEITLSALAFIVEHVKADAAPQIFGQIFQQSLETPGPFFIHFAAQAIRSGLQKPIKQREMVYSPAELIETRQMLR